jgi:hypothetical protein
MGRKYFNTLRVRAGQRGVFMRFVSNDVRLFFDRVLTTYPDVGNINPQTVTDDICCYIEENPELLVAYNALQEAHSSINRQIAGAIKDRFNLRNAPNRNEHPRSKLLATGYSEFERA